MCNSAELKKTLICCLGHNFHRGWSVSSSPQQSPLFPSLPHGFSRSGGFPISRQNMFLLLLNPDLHLPFPSSEAVLQIGFMRCNALMLEKEIINAYYASCKTSLTHSLLDV